MFLPVFFTYVELRYGEAACKEDIVIDVSRHNRKFTCKTADTVEPLILPTAFSRISVSRIPRLSSNSMEKQIVAMGDSGQRRHTSQGA